jgi:hypothetical protein
LFENNVFLVAQHMMQFAVTGQACRAHAQRAFRPGPSTTCSRSVNDGEQIFLAVVSDTVVAVLRRASAWPTSKPTRGWPATTTGCARASWMMPMLRERLADHSSR